MGAAASVQDLVQGLGDQVTKDECRTLSQALSWKGDIEDWILDVFDDDTISKAKVNNKLAREQRKVAKQQQEAEIERGRTKEVSRVKGERIYNDAMDSKEVAGLSALPASFRDGVVPRDTTEVNPPCSCACFQNFEAPIVPIIIVHNDDLFVLIAPS